MDVPSLRLASMMSHQNTDTVDQNRQFDQVLNVLLVGVGCINFVDSWLVVAVVETFE
jgi:hypothetical protein